jgi:hypothetical protein
LNHPTFSHLLGPREQSGCVLETPAAALEAGVLAEQDGLVGAEAPGLLKAFGGLAFVPLAARPAGAEQPRGGAAGINSDRGVPSVLGRVELASFQRGYGLEVEQNRLVVALGIFQPNPGQVGPTVKQEQLGPRANPFHMPIPPDGIVR